MIPLNVQSIKMFLVMCHEELPMVKHYALIPHSVTFSTLMAQTQGLIMEGAPQNLTNTNK